MVVSFFPSFGNKLRPSARGPDVLSAVKCVLSACNVVFVCLCVRVCVFKPSAGGSDGSHTFHP